jgi:hypothetical protein
MKSFVVVALAACGSPASSPDAHGDGQSIDAASVDDGTPTRRTCTSQFGNALTTTFGRLDGFLVAIVPPGGGPCNADDSHVHLQIQVMNQTYDVAVDVANSAGPDDVHTTTREMALPGAAWSEGWHTGVSVDYIGFGIHSTDLTLETKAQLTTDIMTDLATVNHISVFATGYGPDGVHLVHREGSLHDGLIVTQPLSPTAHLRLFSFSTQTF